MASRISRLSSSIVWSPAVIEMVSEPSAIVGVAAATSASTCAFVSMLAALRDVHESVSMTSKEVSPTMDVV